MVKLRRRHRVLWLIAALVVSGAVGNVYALDRNYGVWYWGTANGPALATKEGTASFSCFVSGVAGNISDGVQPGTQTAIGLGCGQIAGPSVAGMTVSNGQWVVNAHGGACAKDDNAPVLVEATCFQWPMASTGGMWVTGDNPVRIADQAAPNGLVRQCFLTGLQGVGGAWGNANNYLRVRRVPVADSSHPTPGWYVEGNLPYNNEGNGGDSKARGFAGCTDFPVGTRIYNGTTALETKTTTFSLPSGTGIRACALSGIKGAFDVNNYSDGAVMNFPSTQSGNWSLTVTAGKRADWVCMN